MVLSPHSGGGKYLSRTWAAERAAAKQNPDRYSAADLEWLEVSARAVPESTFEAKTASGDRYDIRDPRYRPEVGA